MSWTPLLTGEVADLARRTCRDLAGGLDELAGDSTPIGLHQGLAGVALALRYVGEGLGDDEMIRRSEDRVERAVERSSEQGPDSASLATGFVGVAWTLDHLAELDALPADEDPNADTDEILWRALPPADLPADVRERLDFDLFRGLVGLGVYALQRGHRPRAIPILERLVELLRLTGRPEGADRTGWYTPAWLLPPDAAAMYPEGYYNLGLAHGTPCVIAFLARALAPLAARQEVDDLLGRAVRWILARRLPRPESPYFPGIEARGHEPNQSLVSWCYGDLGVGTAVLSAGRRAGRPEWTDAALEVLRSAARRRRGASDFVRDCCLCHGTAGNGHVFARCFHATGEGVFADAARYWFRLTLEDAHDQRGRFGYRTWIQVGPGEMGWRESPGFLSGNAGIALGLLAAATDLEPRWDRLLLVDL